MKAKIIHIIPTLNNGGAENILKHLSLNLSQRDFSQLIITLHGSTNDFHYSSLSKKILILDLRRNYKEIINIYKEERIVVVAWMYKSIFYALLFNLFVAKFHLVFWNIRHSSFRSHQLFQKLFLYIFGFFSNILKSNIIYCSHVSKSYHERFFFRKANSIVIHNRLAKDLNFQYNDTLPPFLLYVGRYDKVKGPDRLLRIIKTYFDENKELKLFIAGSNWKEELIPTSLKNRVSLLGNVKNLSQYYSNAKALLFTSYSEGYPNVLAEAISLGCPVVGFRAGDSKEILGDFKNGFTVESDREFISALEEVFKKPVDLKGRILDSKIQKNRLNFKETVVEYENFLLK